MPIKNIEILKGVSLNFLNYTIIQLVVGFFVSLYLVGIVVWDMDWSNWFLWSSRKHSFFAMSLVYFCSFYSIKGTSIHLRNLNLRYVIPIFIFWLSIFLLLVLVFRLSYSIYFIFFSSVFMLLILLFFEYIGDFSREKIIAYIPLGRVDTPDIPLIKWKKLRSCKMIKKNCVDAIMVDLRYDLPSDWIDFLTECTLVGVPVYHSTRLIELISGRTRIDHMYENDLGSLLPSKTYQMIKRLLDIIVVVMSLPIILPVMIFVGLIVIVDTRGWCIFSQVRVGQGGKPFTMYKFRSMNKNAEKGGPKFAQYDDSRITFFGKFIRKTRIDELPQLLNVLKGEMSLIGPRPEQIEFTEKFKQKIAFYRYRHIVKPGISGWAQVEYGYTSTSDATRVKLEYDFYYIKNFSFSLDLLIFFKTIKTVLTGFGSR